MCCYFPRKGKDTHLGYLCIEKLYRKLSVAVCRAPRKKKEQGVHWMGSRDRRHHRYLCFCLRE